MSSKTPPENQVIHVVFDGKTGEISEPISERTDVKAREYLNANCIKIPIGDTEAVFEHARELARIGVNAEWAKTWLIKLCSVHWIGAEKHNSIGRAVDHAFRAEEIFPSAPLIHMHRIDPTPFTWIDPSKIPPRSWLYRPMYIRKFISLNVATGGTGKTSLALVENLAMVTGKALLGVQPGEEDLRSWYWNGEDPLDEMQRRLAAAIKYYRLTKEELDGRFFLDSGRDMPIKIAALEDGKSTVSTPLIEDIIYAIRHYRLDVLNIDPFVSCHSVSENDTAAIQTVVEQWGHITNETSCAIPLWHHSRKTRGADATIEDSRGASALIGAARGRRVLNKMTAQEAESANLGPEERGRYFWGDCSLSSMVAPAESRQWYRLESVNLGNGECGDGDEVGVAVAWEHPGNGAPELTEDQEAAALAAIREGGPWRVDAQSDAWIGIPIMSALGLPPTNKLHRKQTVTRIKEWLETERLEIFQQRDPKQRKMRDYIRAM